MPNKARIGIVGASGYTGGELIRILLWHPGVEIAFLHSRSLAGKTVASHHTDLFGDTDLCFTNKLDPQVDVLFLCLPHGETKPFLDSHPFPDVKIIDLSNDFRLEGDHGYIYGLPELNREQIKQAKKVANPGCFATAIQLALLPLAKEKLLKDEVHINAITGSTGAGIKYAETLHFTRRHSNLSTYKAFTHQHLGEIIQSVRQLQSGYDKPVNLIPYRGDFTRGIIASVYTSFTGTIQQAKEYFDSYYRIHPFTHVSDINVELKQVVNTNKCLLYLEKQGDKLLIMSIIDNLVKGASGQAVQNMNLMMGWDEMEGLRLKPSAY